MKAILLLGGFGTRLRPLTNDMPKQMLPVRGQPMIEQVCEHLYQHSVTEVVLALGYRAEVFTAAYPKGRIGKLRYQVAVESEPRGTAGAVRFAAEACGVTGTFLVLNGDVLTDLDLRALTERHEQLGAEATIALQPVTDPTPYGLVRADPSGRVLAFLEKPAVKPSAGYGSAQLALSERPTVNAGTYVLTSATLDRIAPDRPVSIEREIFPQIVADRALAALVADAYWLDTGTPQHYLAANLDILAGRRPDVKVVMAPSARVHPEARIQMSVIGRECEIGSGAVVQRSVLGDGCLLAAGATVIDSVLGAGAIVGAGAMLTDCSVVGAGEHVAAQAVLRAQRQPRPD